MALTDINSEDRLVQRTFADHLQTGLGWESVYAYDAETFGPHGTLGRTSEREVVLVRDLRAALERLNPDFQRATPRNCQKRSMNSFGNAASRGTSQANAKVRPDFLGSTKNPKITWPLG